MKNKLFRKILYIISILSIVITVIGAVFLPNIVREYYENFNALDVPKGIVVFLYITAVPFLVILLEVMQLCKSLFKDIYLNKRTIQRLKVISIASFVEFIIYLISSIFIYRSLVFLVITIAILMIFMITAVIREVISTGIKLKEENDLTI